jgi:hypothetical protein
VAIALCNVVLTYLPEVQSAGIEIMNEKERREREAAAARYPPFPFPWANNTHTGIGCEGMPQFAFHRDWLQTAFFLARWCCCFFQQHGIGCEWYIYWFQTAVSLFTVVLVMNPTLFFQRGCRFCL